MCYVIAIDTELSLIFFIILTDCQQKNKNSLFYILAIIDARYARYNTAHILQ